MLLLSGKLRLGAFASGNSTFPDYCVANYFAGVYFTSVGPYNDPKSILLNNYDDRGRVINSKRLWDRIQCVVEVAMPVNEVEKITGVKNQDIYLYPEYDVILLKYQHSIYRNPRA